ncbi:MAG TPA: rhodanese-like domain-containing protein [Saprospiraceae bacterium]|nr:rhodanese-like domain-containing protein [Saprospiraceae bacterium]HNM26695.1 rhodanese-like domain-containing protein [Saprospiraceae bacterium]
MDITVQELKQRLQAGEKFLFLDVRDPWEHEEFNIGATLMPLGELVNRMWELDEYKDKEIVVHCKSGGRSGMAQQLMQSNGFTHVRNVIGGIMAWKEAFGPTKP